MIYTTHLLSHVETLVAGLYSDVLTLAARRENVPLKLVLRVAGEIVEPLGLLPALTARCSSGGGAVVAVDVAVDVEVLARTGIRNRTIVKHGMELHVYERGGLYEVYPWCQGHMVDGLDALAAHDGFRHKDAVEDASPGCVVCRGRGHAPNPPCGDPVYDDTCPCALCRPEAAAARSPALARHLAAA